MPKTLASELEMFRYFELTPDLVCIASKNGYFKHINNAVVTTLGYSREELLSRPIFSFLHPDDLESTSRTRNEMLEGKALINFDNRYITKQGEIVWLNWTSVYLPESDIVFAIAKNITNRKHAEQHVKQQFDQFRNLANHFKASMEHDKKSIASELHEQLAQLASAIKIDLEWLRENLPHNEASRERISHATSISQMLIDGIRKISYDISPDMLNELGLNETLRSLCQEYTRHHKVTCKFESNYDDACLTREVQLDLYRITQQLLKNVVDHADATNVRVSVMSQGGHIYLTVIDDVKGFDATVIDNDRGLSGIRTRATSIQGRLEVDSDPHSGTRVQIIIPEPEFNIK